MPLLLPLSIKMFISVLPYIYDRMKYRTFVCTAGVSSKKSRKPFLHADVRRILAWIAKELQPLRVKKALRANVDQGIL